MGGRTIMKVWSTDHQEFPSKTAVLQEIESEQ